MSNLLWHRQGTRAVTVKLPHNHDRMLSGWAEIRSQMVRTIHPDFTRSEWAYLIQFLDSHHLQGVFDSTFGQAEDSAIKVDRILIPKARIALWLPNNVGLLGPLTLILISLTGGNLRVKAGSRSDDICASLLNWLREVAPKETLGDWLNSVTVEKFDRNDPRNAEMSEWADVRILFGSNEAAAGIEKLPHHYGSKGVYFSHKVSEAWVEASCIDDAFASDLARVFGIYGQAGCTSPKRVVVIDGSKEDALRLADLLRAAWDSANPRKQPRHVASETAMAIQWGRALGQIVLPLGSNSAVALVGPTGPLPLAAHMAISLQWGSLSDVLTTQSDQLQSIGHALLDPTDPRWVTAIAQSPAVRFVPLRQMHHFGPVWDGIPWWRGLFDEKIIEVSR